MLRSLRHRSTLVDRAILATPTQRMVRGVRRRTVLSDPMRFAALEFFGRDDRGALHRLRGSSTHVAIRHRSRDVDVFDEIWTGSPAYEPPTEVAHLLVDGMSVLDLGGNVGMFGAFVLHRFPKARVISLEPDPFNLPVIEGCMRANHGRWDLLRACASTHNHDVYLDAGDYADSRVTDGPGADSISVPAIDIFPYIDRADFVKVDIEGSEWPILNDPRFQHVSPSVIVLEWHEHGCPSEDAHSAAVSALRGAGYRTIGDSFGYPHGLIWAWREPAGSVA